MRFTGRTQPVEQARLAAICAGGYKLAAALHLADEFAELNYKRSHRTLIDWLVRREASLNPDLHRFAERIQPDEAAVLTAPWKGTYAD
jgi:hypothetical protein